MLYQFFGLLQINSPSIAFSHEHMLQGRM